MHCGGIAVVSVVVTAARREMNRAGYLFVEEDISDGFRDAGIESEGEFAYVARALVGIEYLIRFLGVIRGRFHNLAVFEDESDVLEFDAVFDGGDVIMNDAVDAVFNGCGVYFSVRNIALALALYSADTFYREGEVGILRDDAYFVRLIHEVDERRHRFAHLLVVQTAYVEIEVFVRFCAHARELAHAFRGVAENDPFRLFHA